jgi:hypothetical protein
VASNQSINIRFPLQNSPKGDYLRLNSISEPNEAIKSDLMFLLLTQKGQRYMLPGFGCNLINYIFEPNDSTTLSQIQEEITNTVKQYIPNLQINSITVVPSTNNDYSATVTVNYSITDNVFTSNNVLVINL